MSAHPVSGSIHEAEDMSKSFLLDTSEFGKRTLQPSAKKDFGKNTDTFVGLMPLADRSPTPFCDIAQSGAFNDHRLQLRDEVRYVYGPITTTLERAPVADKGLVLKHIARNCLRWRAPIA